MMTRWCLALAMAVATAVGAQPKLEIAVTPAMGPARSGGPLPVEIVTRWAGPDLLRGRIRFTGSDYQGRRLRLETESMAIPAGEQHLLRLLPAVTRAMNADALELVIEFVTEDDDVIQVAKQSFPTPGEDQRRITIACVHPVLTGAPVPADVIDAIRIDRHLRVSGMRDTVEVRIASVSVDAFPAQPLYLCAFDMIALTLDAIAALDDARSVALERWVDAGGSVFVWAPGATPGTPRCVELLERLAPNAGVTRDSGGDIRIATGLHRAARGLGRVVVAAGEPSMTTWPNRDVRWLWKMRWRVAQPEGRTTEDRMGHVVAHTDAERSIVERLLPDQITLVPLPLLGLILFGFVLAIGPGEWFGLGAIRRRWLTWITFPVICVLFTLLTIAVTNAYLGQSDRDAKIVFIDVGDDGRVLRRNVVGVRFPASERVERHRFERALVSRIDLGRFYGAGWSPSIAAPPRLIGRVGGKVEMENRLRKWTPIVWRALSFDAGETVPALGARWAAPGGIAKSDVADLPNFEAAFRVSGEGAGMRRVHSAPAAGPDTVARRTSVHQLIADLTSRDPIGHFRDVFRVSPTGGDTLEDLTLIDSTDSRSRALVIVTRDELGWTVFRRAYREEG